MYGIEHGIIRYHVNMGTAGGDAEMILYFDHFGQRQLLQIDNSAVGLGTFKVIQEDSIQYGMFDSIQCIKSKRKARITLGNMNFININVPSAKKYGVRKVADTIYLTHPCNIFSVSKGVLGQVVAWKDIPLYIQIETRTKPQITKAYSIDITSEVADSVLNLPRGVKIIDGMNFD